MSSLLPNGKQHFDDNNGRPLVAGRVYYYIPNTSTSKNTWQDEAQTILNTNPIILDARGECTAWGSGRYRQVVRDQFGNLIWDKIVADIGSQFAEPDGAALVGFSQEGPEAVDRNLLEKNREIVSVTDYIGADPTGATPSDDAIESALDATANPYFPDGVFLYTGDIDALFAARPFGPGKIKYDGYEYPTSRDVVENCLWPGDFATWPMGEALGVVSEQRIQIPAGVTHARTPLSDGSSIIHVNDGLSGDGMRIQRNATNANAASHVAVLNLSRAETKPLAGKRCVVGFNGRKGATFSGGNVTVRVQYSREPEQPILAADGTYTNGNVVLATEVFSLTEEYRPRTVPYYFDIDLPVDAIQVAVAIVVPFSGVAGNDDFVEFAKVSICPTATVSWLQPVAFAQQEIRGATRYQTSYPYGSPRGTPTRQGAVSAVAINTSLQWAFAISVEFNPAMTVAPQVLFQSPTSGVESRLLNVDTGATINGLAWELSERGAMITNNGAPTAGNRYLCHWTAQVIF